MVWSAALLSVLSSRLSRFQHKSFFARSRGRDRERARERSWLQIVKNTDSAAIMPVFPFFAAGKLNYSEGLSRAGMKGGLTGYIGRDKEE